MTQGRSRPLTGHLERVTWLRTEHGPGHGHAKAVEKVRKQAGIPGVVIGLWMPGKGSYVRATGVADTATRDPAAVRNRPRWSPGR